MRRIIIVSMRKYARYLLSIIAFGVLIYLFWPMIGQIKDAGKLLIEANWWLLPVVLSVQVLSYFSLAWLNMLALKPFPGNVSFFQLVALLTSIAFIETALPSAGISGVALRVHLLRKRGYGADASTFSLFLETVYLGIAMISIMLFGIVYLLRAGEITAIEIVWLIAIFIILAGLFWWIWRTLHNQSTSVQVMNVIISFWNKLFGRWKMLDDQDQAQKFAVFQNRLVSLNQEPVWMFLLAAFGRILLDVTSLGILFYIFNQFVAPGVLVTGYGITLTLSGLAALPGGLGFADASIPVVFNQLGVNASAALAAGLLYRLGAFWLVRFIGFVQWQWLEGKEDFKTIKGANVENKE
jgi:uncharacterized protein (TIRG00374 family)